MLSNNKNLIKVLKQGDIAVIPTDTIYGLVGNALNKKAVRKIIALKSRDTKKPFIILIASQKDLNLFNIKISEKEKLFLEKIWPNKVSIIFPCPIKKFSYLHRGTDSLAFRYPKNKDLISLLKKTGPLIASSANPSGLVNAENISQARKYFDKKIAVYIGSKNLKSSPSTLIKIDNGKIKILRQGEIKI